MTLGHIWKRILIGLAMLLVVACVFIASVAALGGNGNGTILVSSSNDAQSPFLNTYAVRADGGGYTRVGDDDSSLGSMYSISNDGSTYVFVGTDRSRLTQAIAHQIASGDVMQVYSASAIEGNIPLPSDGRQLTAGSEAIKTTPTICDDGSLAAYVTAAESSLPVASSTIHIVSTASPVGERTIVGIAPQWLSSHSFYYVAPDGVRLYDTVSKTPVMVLPMATAPNIKLAVSPDRTLLAVSIPNSRSVFVYDISDEGLTITPAKTIGIPGFWMVFSPDSRFMAIQTAKEASDGSLSAPSLAIYDTASFAKLRDVTLGDLLNDRLFVTAWIK